MSTIFTLPVIIDAPDKDVVFDGCDFTENATITINNAKSVTLKNCRMYNLIPYAEKSFAITGKEIPVKLVIMNCRFDDNQTASNMTFYNLFELNMILTDGSSISNNWFTKYACTHNVINIYNVANDSNVDIDYNMFEYSANAIRLGIKGEPVCEINVTGNQYQSTDPADNGDWAGLMIIQPYGAETKSFNNMFVELDNISNLSMYNQLVYLFSNDSDTQFDLETNYPKVFINGELMEDLPTAGSTVVGGMVDQNEAEQEIVDDPVIPPTV